MLISSRIKKRHLGSLATLILLFAVSCTEDTPAVFRPRGAAAREINELWWVLFGLGTLTYLVVMGFLVYALIRRRTQQVDRGSDNQNGRRLVWLGGVVFPAIILVIIYGYTLNVLSQLNSPNSSEQVVVEVIGHQWWWEVHYPDREVVAANEIYIPAGQDVVFRLTSDDVIHSFWVPELHGKMDMIPGNTNTWRLQADEPGDYWGLCAEFCGIQHAKMLFLVVAVPPDEFEAWLEQQQGPAKMPQTEPAQAGLEVFMETGCAECHTIRGTKADGDLGPDLTHFASRRILAASAVRNNRGNLAGWITDPHGIKPGSLMPTMELPGPELQSLIAYLESLE